MGLTVDFFDETKEVKDEYKGLIRKLLEKVAQKESIMDGAELSIMFVHNERMKEINCKYRQKNQATDVISFAMEDSVEGEMKIVGMETPRMLGDIIISIPKTKEQAEKYGHSFSRELCFLAVHGFLHVLGYDHMTEEDEKIMFGKQEEILASLGLNR